MSSFQPFDPENDSDEAEIVTLTDEEGRSLSCYIENSLEIEDINYLLLVPVDIPVVIIAWEEETEEEEFSEAILVEDKAEIAQIFDDAKAVLAEQELTLKNTALTLTVSGELPPLEDDSILSLTIDPEEDDVAESEEELQWLASFYHQENKYSIYTPLEPLLFLSKYNHLGELELVSPEDEKMQMILEELLIDEFNYQD